MPRLFCIEAVGKQQQGQFDIFNTNQRTQFTTPRFTQPLLKKGVRLSIAGNG
jgi:putative transposase